LFCSVCCLGGLFVVWGLLLFVLFCLFVLLGRSGVRSGRLKGLILPKQLQLVINSPLTRTKSKYIFVRTVELFNTKKLNLKHIAARDPNVRFATSLGQVAQVFKMFVYAFCVWNMDLIFAPYHVCFFIIRKEALRLTV